MNKTCNKCNKSKDISEFYARPDRKDSAQSYCKICFNKYCIERWIQKKKDAVEYKGGKCIDCKEKFEYYLFDFHHLNPNEKDCDWTKLRIRSWDKIKSELDKCVLLCCMCHRIREHGAADRTRTCSV